MNYVHGIIVINKPDGIGSDVETRFIASELLKGDAIAFILFKGDAMNRVCTGIENRIKRKE